MQLADLVPRQQIQEILGQFLKIQDISGLLD
jgi:hypothetical protein